MTRFLPLALALFVLTAGPALAQPEPRDEILTAQAIAELTLDELFAKLPDNSGKRAGRLIEAEILQRFEKSGSDTTDLLMSWANQAIAEKTYPLALDILDQVVILQPAYAEAWNKRATVHFLLDDYGSSLGDIRQTLALEPRHFGALSGLGLIFEAMDRNEEAIRAFKRALEVNPQLDKVRESLERLEKETAGDDI
jgi:tetratricopeptide (TPR) repeat protein